MSNISQTGIKIVSTQCCFTDHLNQKTVTKITSRATSVNPGQLYVL